jgi:lipid-A-disaccharide synthase
LKLLISAGEASGDQHGARLLEALRKRRPDCRVRHGRARLAAAGLSVVVPSESLSVVGISEVLEKLPSLVAAGNALVASARRERPDAAILIDFPDFHGFLARRLRSLGIPLIYYVSPQVWAWRRGRARTIARRARRIITLFPFEAEIYKALGADAVWAGHPLVDAVREGLREPPPLPAGSAGGFCCFPGAAPGNCGGTGCRWRRPRRSWPNTVISR